MNCRQMKRRFCRYAKEKKSKAPNSCQHLYEFQVQLPALWTKSLPAIGHRISALSHDDNYRKPVQDNEFDVGRFGLASIRRRVRNSNLTCDWVGPNCSWWPPCYMQDRSIGACRIEACMQVCSAMVSSRRQCSPGVALSYLSDDNDLSANLAPRNCCGT